jgi:putative ABC transport system substrate-binding protein
VNARLFGVIAIVFALGLALVLPPAMSADQSTKAAHIAFLTAESAPVVSKTFSAFRERMRELGWVEGDNLFIEAHSADGHINRLPDVTREALQRNPDVLVTGSTPGAIAAKNATHTVPIVAAIGDPLQTGVVSNLARPGGNLTAISTGYTDGFAGKWLELLLEVVPSAKRVAIIWNLGNPVVKPYRPDLEKVALARGVQLRFIDVREADRLQQAFQQAKHDADVAVVVCENLVIQNADKVVNLAAQHRIPTMYCLSRFARMGGLIAYGTDINEMYRRVADYVDKVLRGAYVGDLPVQQATKFELVVNLRTAKALGIKIPESILLHADEVIR